MNNKSNPYKMVKLTMVSLVFTASLLGSVHAQEEVTAEHRNAAIAAMEATGATDRLDRILPELAEFTKAGLIANRPDIETEISNIVDDVAIELAARRGPLETEVSALYTSKFSQEELEQVAEFFKSEIGIKFLQATPGIFREVDGASRVWRDGLVRDMNKKVVEKLKEAGLF